MRVPDATGVQELESLMASSGPRNPIFEKRDFYSGTHRPNQTRLPMKQTLLPGIEMSPPQVVPPQKSSPWWAIGALAGGIIIGYILALITGSQSTILGLIPSGHAASGATGGANFGKGQEAFQVAQWQDGAQGTHLNADSSLNAPLYTAKPVKNYASPALGGSIVPQLTHFERGLIRRLLGLDPPNLQELVAARATPLVCFSVQSKGSLVVKLAVDVRVEHIVVRGQGRCGVRLPNMAGSAERFMTPTPGGASRAEFAVDSTIGILTVHLIGECCVDGVEVWGVHSEEAVKE